MEGRAVTAIRSGSPSYLLPSVVCAPCMHARYSQFTPFHTFTNEDAAGGGRPICRAVICPPQVEVGSLGMATCAHVDWISWDRDMR